MNNLMNNFMNNNSMKKTSNRSLCLWSAMKKKPLHTKELAHGKQEENDQANWISAIATLINTDILASGNAKNDLTNNIQNHTNFNCIHCRVLRWKDSIMENRRQFS